MFRPQDPLLKRRAQIEASDVDREANVVSGQKCHNPVCNDIDLGTRRRDRIREQGFDNVLGRKSGLGEQDARDLRLPLMDRPKDSHRTELRPANAAG
jgi:hypothetical protein